MPRKYTPVVGSPRLMYTSEVRDNALEAIRNGMPVRTASRSYGVPTTTLHHLVHGDVQEPGKIGRKTALLPQEERVIAQNLAALADIGYAIDKDKLCDFVQSYVNHAGRPVLLYSLGMGDLGKTGLVFL